MSLPRYLLKLGDSREVVASMRPECVDALVCDPPAGIEFMGKAWDQDHGGRDRWCSVHRSIFGACLRAMKPGAHGLVWALPRTAHWTGTALEEAGFEVRDVLIHLFGTGFPKSLDVSKAIDGSDRVRAARDRALRFTAWMRTTGLTAIEINAATDSFMGSHYLTAAEQPGVATEDLFCRLRPLLAARGVRIPAEVEELVAQRTVESENMKRRPVVGATFTHDLTTSRPVPIVAQGLDASTSRVVNHTAPATPEAARWNGWGTALKPAAEHWILVRKPLAGTVADNVLRFGVGGLNIEGCRLATADVTARHWHDTPSAGKGSDHIGQAVHHPGSVSGGNAAGRWPANVTLDEEAAGQLDDQSGASRSPVAVGRGGEMFGGGDRARPGEIVPCYGDSGGASRFFYVSKPARAERNGGLDPAIFPKGNDHPTVKAVRLMRWLCRLITPPGGVVLDPFMGSGSTGIAALAEGFHFIGIEREPRYLLLAQQRIAHATAGTDTDRESAERGG